MVFRSHCAGALTSINAYPRCELRQQINGEDTFWDYSDEHELNVTLRITHLPDEKQEVCVVQLKGTNTPSTTNGTSEVLRVEYRQDGDSGWHLEVNESSGPQDIIDYSLGDRMSIRAYVNNDNVTLQMENLDNGDTFSYNYDSDFSHGYFKAGAYTQSSIWKEKNGVADEDPDAYSEVRFSQFTLGESDGDVGSAIPSAPSNRVVSNITNSGVTFNWAYSSAVDHYNLRYRPESSSSWTTLTSLRLSEGDFSVSGSTAGLTVTNLLNDADYEWQIRAKNSNNEGSSYTSGEAFTTVSSSIVKLRKRNISSYAIDGNHGGADGQNIYLWRYRASNVNQQWSEINRGGGYFSYQKINTDYVIDGNHGGANGQNVYLWSVSPNNYNQHWNKIHVAGNVYRLVKRNASDFSIDAGDGGSNRQNVYLWPNEVNNQNMQWVIAD